MLKSRKKEICCIQGNEFHIRSSQNEENQMMRILRSHRHYNTHGTNMTKSSLASLHSTLTNGHFSDQIGLSSFLALILFVM